MKKTPAKKKSAAKQSRRVLIITGLSGAGMSTALKSLEDMGYQAIDNLPLSLLKPLIDRPEGQDKPVAVGIDSRSWDFSPVKLVRALVAAKKQKGLRAEMLFIDCQDDVLQQRYTETRRVHPLAHDRPVRDGVLQERQMMRPLRAASDHVIDTSAIKAADLRRIVEGYFTLGDEKGVHVFVTSFGFKNGLPREADLVFDVRFIDNPYWDPKLRPLSGLDPAIVRKIGGDAAYKSFFRNLTGLLKPLLPRYDREGKRYLTIAIGCTGGRHRSVFVAERLNDWLAAQGYVSGVRHRDMEGWAAKYLTPAAPEKKKPAARAKKTPVARAKKTPAARARKKGTKK